MQKNNRLSTFQEPNHKRLLLRLSLPAMIGLLVNSLYTMVDMLFVGNAVGPMGIAALGLSMPVYLIITGIALMIGVGGASLVSRQLGAHQSDEVGKTVFTSLVGIVAMTVILSAVGLFWFSTVARTLGATADTAPFLGDYLGTLLWGAPFIASATVLNALLRAEGQAKKAMLANLIGNGLNILLDALFILSFRWGVSGAALATIIGQSAAAVFSLSMILSKRSAIMLRQENCVFSLNRLGRITTLGSATLIRQLGTSVVTIVVNQSLSRYGGTLAIASYGITGTLLMFLNMPNSGIVQGFQPIAGYHHGAKHMQTVYSILKLTLLTTILLGTLLYLPVVLFTGGMLRLFTADTTLMTRAIPAARIILIGLPLLGVQSVGTVYFQSTGRALPAISLWIVRQFVLVIPLIMLFGSLFGTIGIYVAFPLADALSAALIGTLALRSSVALARSV